VFFVITMLSSGQPGFGDVTLYSAVSLYLGWAGLHVVYTALAVTTALAGLAAAALVVFRGAHAQDRFALGPMILAGAFVALMLA
jgi:leader peptidase (prepilin peptidase)/N-methyltransferase